MVVDGNDDRGIDVGSARRRLPLDHIRTHVFDRDAEGVVFSRDCCEYHLRGPGGGASRYSSTTSSPRATASRAIRSERGGGLARRHAWRRSTPVCAAAGIDRVAVVGDLNDTPDSDALAPLLVGTDLRDISTHPAFDFGTRRGTFRGGNEAGEAGLRPAVAGAVRRGDRRRGVPARRLARSPHRRPVGDVRDADGRGPRRQRPRRDLRRPGAVSPHLCPSRPARSGRSRRTEGPTPVRCAPSRRRRPGGHRA